MNFAGCLRPAACSQRPACFLALGDGSQTQSARVILITRPALGGLLHGSKCQLACSKARKGTLTITAASRKSKQQVRHRKLAVFPEPTAAQPVGERQSLAGLPSTSTRIRCMAGPMYRPRLPHILAGHLEGMLWHLSKIMHCAVQ